MSIVPTNLPYNSYILRQNIISLNTSFPFLNVQTVGNSVLGENLYVIKLGKGEKKVFYSASFHANEWITSVLLMKFVEDYCNSYVNNSKLYGYSVRNLFNSASIYIMPMVNPDGVNLVTGAIPSSSSAYLSVQRIARNFPEIPFVYGWKANIRGVDFKNYQPICKALQLFTCTILRTFIFILFYQFFTTIINSTYFQTIIFS